MLIGSEGIEAQSGIQIKYINPGSCATCTRKSSCQVNRLALNFIENYEDWMIKRSTYNEGEEVLSSDGDHEGLYVVKSGVYESYTMDSEGDFKVIGFHMPGDFFGIGKSNENQYYHYVKALESGTVCKIGFSVFEEYSSNNYNLTMSLINLLGEIVSQNDKSIFLHSRMDAKRRFANFILDMSRRTGKAGFGKGSFKLYMSRSDIANYLGLSTETISRLFTRFKERNILTVEYRLIHINDMKALYEIAHSNEEKEYLMAKDI
tara:strand:- start:38438 stop:39223 length:786 start_codon:yes stop_codon:yes gene_type:complete